MEEPKRVDFESFPKIPRWSRDIVITEKIDGTNAQILLTHELQEHPHVAEVKALDGLVFIYAGSRTRYITPKDDNFGFAAWVKENAEDLVNLGLGRHYGEWWGKGIQRGYGLDHRRFSLFNVGRWVEQSIIGLVRYGDRGGETITTGSGNEKRVAPKCCHVVPQLYEGPMEAVDGVQAVDLYLEILCGIGSKAAPGFMKPEGIIIYHTASRHLYKKTIDKDETWKGKDG